MKKSFYLRQKQYIQVSKVNKQRLFTYNDNEESNIKNGNISKTSNSPKNSIEPQMCRWRINKEIVGQKVNRLLTQYSPESDIDHLKNTTKLIQPSLRIKINPKRSITTKRNNSISDYSNTPQNIISQRYPSSSKQRSYSIQQQIQSSRQQQSFFQSLGIKDNNNENEMKIFMQTFEISLEEWDKFGNRFPQNYQREKLLGRGGFSLIWLAKDKQGMNCSIKQIPKKSKHETHLKELAFCSQFFNKGGQIKLQYLQCEGIKHLCKMIDYIIDTYDVFIIYELCGFSLGTQLYDFELQHNIYKLIPQKLSLLFKQFPNFLFKFIKRLAQALELLTKTGWVHSDIKSENILISYQQHDIDIKLIDYGSSFKFQEVFDKFSMATPEYMAPEMLTFILKENQMQYDLNLIESIKNYDKNWVIDMWGLGCVTLEIVSGLPLWMSYDTQVINYKGQKVLSQGLFAVNGRSFNKIVEKQIKTVINLDYVLKEQNYSGITISPLLIQLLKGMLSINPKQRYSPSQIIYLLQDY